MQSGAALAWSRFHALCGSEAHVQCHCGAYARLNVPEATKPTLIKSALVACANRLTTADSAAAPQARELNEPPTKAYRHVATEWTNAKTLLKLMSRARGALSGLESA